jgi:hypothetical protein
MVMLMIEAILLALQPAFTVEKHQENCSNGRHQQQTEGVAQGPTQLRHIPRTDLRLKIHAVDAGNETQGMKIVEIIVRTFITSLR